MNDSIKMIIVWLLIGTVVFVGWQWFEHNQKARGYSVVSTNGKTEVTVKRSRQGHYFLNGKVNGISYEFLVDTGATRTTIPKSVVDKTGVTITGTEIFNTANGQVKGQMGNVTIELDGIRIEQHPVAFLETIDEQPLLGMDILKRMTITQGNGVMTFKY